MTTFDLEVKPYLLAYQAQAYGRRMGTPDRTREGFGMRLKAAREAKDLTQQQVADKFDVKKATVSAWENGVGVPDALRLRQLAKLYGVSADALLWENALSNEAMQVAADFDSLNESQRKTFRAVWLAFIQNAASDEDVANHIKAPKGAKKDEKAD